MFHDTITVLNKTKNLTTHKDEWNKVVIHGCNWASKTIRNVSGSTASISYTLSCRIPYRGVQISINLGDYVVKGELKEEVTADNIVKLINSYRPNAFMVKAYKDNTADRLKHYHVEGV